MSDDLIVILTALNLEYQSVHRRLSEPQLRTHPALTRFEVGHIEGGGRIALALAGKGNHSAAVIAERAIAQFSPVAVLFVGVAGALRSKIALGDVVVATRVYAYHGATSTDDGLKARPRGWDIAHGPEQIAQHLARTGAWRAETLDGPAPTVHFGPIAAGEIVQDSANSDHARWFRDHYHDTLAVEMESAGMAAAGHLNGVPAVTVRGISDRADGTKTTSDHQNWQPRAADNAAAFAVALAHELIDKHPMSTPGAPETSGTAEDRPTVTNSASGNAWVGVQAGQVTGDLTFGMRPDSRG